MKLIVSAHMQYAIGTSVPAYVGRGAVCLHSAYTEGTPLSTNVPKYLGTSFLR